MRFALLYFAALLGGSAGVMLLNQNFTELHGGASGAVFGLMGAAAVVLFQRGINPLTTGLGMTLILNLLITFSIPGISIGGHLGGLVAGALAGVVHRRRASRAVAGVGHLRRAGRCWRRRRRDLLRRRESSDAVPIPGF